MDLVEPLLRRATFLTQTAEELDLTERVTVVRARSDEVTTRYDAVLSRALAPLDRLVRWCLPLLAEGGSILALKGSSAQQEVAKHRALLRREGLVAKVVELQADSAATPATVITIQRV